MARSGAHHKVRQAAVALVAFVAVVAPSWSEASAIRVSPVIIDLTAPAAATVITLHNEGIEPVAVQARVFQWVQHDGVEQLLPTTDVVASPPAAKLAPGGDYTVRIVRIDKAAIAGQASYRLLIDELPSAAKKRSGTVSFVFRQSVPVFFANGDASLPKVNWTAKVTGRRLEVTASNAGERRLKIWRFKVVGAKGQLLAHEDGLLGYVLGKSTMRWSFPLSGAMAGSVTGKLIGITAESEAGAFNVKATLQGS